MISSYTSYPYEFINSDSPSPYVGGCTYRLLCKSTQKVSTFYAVSNAQ